ncbi:MAG: selenide, water dikinase SelD, partial [Pseudomonadota bacterium]
LSTDHLRAFTRDPVTFTRIAAVHAMGDIWAMGAQPQAALSTVILPHMAADMAAATLADISETAVATFAVEGAEVVGGHSSYGDALTIGFAVTGICDGPPRTLAGGQAGDALVLTRPIGSGVVLAGAMRLRVKGPDLAATLATMGQSQGAAARILAPAARAMTDVTGFGLAGHVLSLCRASHCGATLMLDAMPTYPGALGLATSGLRSSLWPANRQAVGGDITVQAAPRADLLFDPQTAGGLLAAVPANAVEDLLAALRDAGTIAGQVGHLTEGPPHITVV